MGQLLLVDDEPDLIRMAVPEALTRFPQSILGLLPGLG